MGEIFLLVKLLCRLSNKHENGVQQSLLIY